MFEKMEEVYDAVVALLASVDDTATMLAIVSAALDGWGEAKGLTPKDVEEMVESIHGAMQFVHKVVGW